MRPLDLGLSQPSLAHQLGVNRNVTTNREAGLQEPCLEVMPKMVAFLGYDVSTVHIPLAEQIGAGRRSVGLTQEAFAEQLGVSGDTVNLWQSGRREPTGLVMRRLGLSLTQSVSGPKPSL